MTIAGAFTVCYLVAVAVTRRVRSDALIGALRHGDDAGAIKLLESGADPNSQSYTEYWSPIDALDNVAHGRPYHRYSLSALMLAAIGDRRNVVKALLDRGAAVDQMTTRGSTAMSFAIIYHHPAVEDILAAHGGHAGCDLREDPCSEAQLSRLSLH